MLTFQKCTRLRDNKNLDSFLTEWALLGEDAMTVYVHRGDRGCGRVGVITYLHEGSYVRYDGTGTSELATSSVRDFVCLSCNRNDSEAWIYAYVDPGMKSVIDDLLIEQIYPAYVSPIRAASYAALSGLGAYGLTYLIAYLIDRWV